MSEAASPAKAASYGEHFDRPIFVLRTPRSGSTLLFETLAQASDLYTVGGESHRLIEDIPHSILQILPIVVEANSQPRSFLKQFRL